MMTYSLWLHGKQGDDFGSIEAETLSERFKKFADHFEACRQQCVELAAKLEGVDANFHADGQFISLSPNNRRADKKLFELAKAELITTEEFDMGD